MRVIRLLTWISFKDECDLSFSNYQSWLVPFSNGNIKDDIKLHYPFNIDNWQGADTDKVAKRKKCFNDVILDYWDFNSKSFLLLHGLIPFDVFPVEGERMNLCNLLNGISIVMTKTAEKTKVSNKIPAELIQMWGEEK